MSSKCRVCHSKNLDLLLDFGDQSIVLHLLKNSNNNHFFILPLSSNLQNFWTKII